MHWDDILVLRKKDKKEKEQKENTYITKNKGCVSGTPKAASKIFWLQQVFFLSRVIQVLSHVW